MIIECTRDQIDTGTLLEYSLTITQLEVGILSPILSSITPTDFIYYTERTWIHSLKEGLILIQGKISLSNHWNLQLQQERDSQIMSRILEKYTISYLDKRGKKRQSKPNSELIKLLNRCQM